MIAQKPLATIALLCLGALATLQAEDKPPVQTEIESVRLRVQNDGDNAYFLFSEEVILNATNMHLECEKLEIFATREAENEADVGRYGAIKQIIASGKVKIVQEERTAYCEKATVQPNEERIVLNGSPAIVEQAGGILEGLEIILKRADGSISVDGSTKTKVRLTGPSISDLGFEQRNPVPTPESVEAAENAAEKEVAPEGGDTTEEPEKTSEETSEEPSEPKPSE